MSGAAPKGTCVENSQAKGPGLDDTPESHAHMAPKKQSSVRRRIFQVTQRRRTYKGVSPFFYLISVGQRKNSQKKENDHGTENTVI